MPYFGGENVENVVKNDTPLKFNISPLKNGCLEDYKPFLFGFGLFSGANR